MRTSVGERRPQRLAAVDDEQVAGDPGRIGRDEEGDRAGDVVRGPEPAGRDLAQVAPRRSGVLGDSDRVRSVAIRPGPTALTVIPWGANSIAAVRAIARTPAFEAL